MLRSKVRNIVFLIFFWTISEAFYKENNRVPTCENEYSVCNVIHNRFWMPNLIQSICNCQLPNVCSNMYSNDGNFMNVNSRTQIKFCSPIIMSLENCKEDQVALTQKVNITQNDLANMHVEVKCKCNSNMYWEYLGTDGSRQNKTYAQFVNKYSCSDLINSFENDFCGNARSDLGILYQFARCPNNHSCSYDPEIRKENGTELFYEGSIFKARCVPY